MIISYGDTSKFGSLHWYYLELRSEHTIEATLRRMCANVASIFQASPIEIFVPIKERDLNKCVLSTQNCIYVRSKDFSKLLRLKTVTGIVGLYTSGDSARSQDAIKIDNDFVQSQIVDSEKMFQERGIGTGLGNFVRILDGEYRDWCGTVVSLDNENAVVLIQLKTKLITVETPIKNLIDKNSVPANQRVFYYSDEVGDIAASGLEELIQEDLTYVQVAPEIEDGFQAAPQKKLGRNQTVTAIVTRQLTLQNSDPRSIAKYVAEALASGKIKKPRNLSIIHTIIKTKILELYFQVKNPDITSYKEGIVYFGEQYRFSLSDLTKILSKYKG